VRHVLHESVALKLLHLLFHQLFHKRKRKVIKREEKKRKGNVILRVNIKVSLFQEVDIYNHMHL